MTYYRFAAHPHLVESPTLFTLPIDEKSLELAHLFLEEELWASIKDDTKTLDKDAVYEVVAIARKIARAGFSTVLVDTDEFLDIAQIYSSISLWVTGYQQDRHLQNPREIAPFKNVKWDGVDNQARRIIDYLATITVSPNPDEAATLLVGILSQLKEHDNSAWTARVAAVLAYLSVSTPDVE